MLAELDRVLRGKRKESLAGDGVQAGRVREAEDELASALKILGWDLERVAKSPKGPPRKQVLAWWLRRRTVVGRRWLAERLNMGHETRVTWAVRGVTRSPARQLVRWRKRLEATKGM